MKPSILILLAVVVFGCSDNGTMPSATTDEPPQFVMQWGKKLSVPGRLHKPLGICVGPDGRIYVSDFDTAVEDELGTIQVYSNSGEFIRKWNSGVAATVTVSPKVVYVIGVLSGLKRYDNEGNALGPFSFTGIRGIAADGDSTVYVVGTYIDTSRGGPTFVGPSAWKLSTDEQILESWNHTELGRLTAGADGNVYILVGYDFGATISKYNASGLFLDKWPVSDWETPDNQMAVDSNGNVYISYWVRGEIHKFNSAGRFLTKWSEVSPNHEPIGTPGGLAIDAEDNLYVTDWVHGRVVKYSLR